MSTWCCSSTCSGVSLLEWRRPKCLHSRGLLALLSVEIPRRSTDAVLPPRGDFEVIIVAILLTLLRKIGNLSTGNTGSAEVLKKNTLSDPRSERCRGFTSWRPGADTTGGVRLPRSPLRFVAHLGDHCPRVSIRRDTTPPENEFRVARQSSTGDCARNRDAARFTSTSPLVSRVGPERSERLRRSLGPAAAGEPPKKA